MLSLGASEPAWSESSPDTLDAFADALSTVLLMFSPAALAVLLSRSRRSEAVLVVFVPEPMPTPLLVPPTPLRPRDDEKALLSLDVARGSSREPAPAA